MILLFPAHVATAASLDRIDLLSGYVQADLYRHKHYEAIPLFVGFDIDLSEASGLARRTGCAEMHLVMEPYCIAITDPRDNVEFGVNASIRMEFLPCDRLRPYVQAGFGVDYMTLHTREQSTQHNFASQVAVGARFRLRESLWFQAEYRLRHLSNAGIDHPNSGIDPNAYLCGLSVEF